jgi:hypothetical protein
MEYPAVQKPFHDLGRRAFVEALSLINKALKDPNESQSDETLMAVLVLNMAEVCEFYLPAPRCIYGFLLAGPPSTVDH